jgi:hypothetical protein
MRLGTFREVVRTDGGNRGDYEEGSELIFSKEPDKITCRSYRLTEPTILDGHSNLLSGFY